MTGETIVPRNRRVVLITGCSSGIGNALAREFYAQGLHVIATARKTSSLSDLKGLSSGPGFISTLSLDVTDNESVEAAKNGVEILTGGRLDILVNNAGRGYPMPALDISISQARSVFETNVLGVMALTQALTPLLISTASSLSRSPPLSRTFLGLPLATVPGYAAPTIVQIGSIAAIMPFAFGSVYNASKAALHAFSNTLRLELAPFGVRVVVVVTGAVRSNIAVARDRSDGLQSLPQDSLYLPIADGFNKRQTYSQIDSLPTDEYARQVVEAALRTQPPTEIWRGNKAKLVWFIFTFLGRWIFDVAMTKMFGLDRLKALVVRERKNA